MKKSILVAALAIVGFLGAVRAAQPVRKPAADCCGTACCDGGACCGVK